MKPCSGDALYMKPLDSWCVDCDHTVGMHRSDRVCSACEAATTGEQPDMDQEHPW